LTRRWLWNWQNSQFIIAEGHKNLYKFGNKVDLPNLFASSKQVKNDDMLQNKG